MQVVETVSNYYRMTAGFGQRFAGNSPLKVVAPALGQ